MWTTFGIGSLPVGLTRRARFGLPTRPQWTDVANSRDMFSELDRLVAGGEVEPWRAVRKAQLPGPVTLSVTGRQVSDAELVRAVQTLRAMHPRLVTVWLDEPVLADDASDYARVAEAIGALARAFPALHWGVHTCGVPRIERLLALPLTWLSIDAWLLDDADLRQLASTDKRIAWGIVPTVRAVDDATLEQKLSTLSPRPTLDALTTSCGLGTLSPETAEERVAQLDRLARRHRSSPQL